MGHFRSNVYEQRCELMAETLLFEANRQGAKAERDVCAVTVGLGLGVWANNLKKFPASRRDAEHGTKRMANGDCLKEIYIKAFLKCLAIHSQTDALRHIKVFEFNYAFSEMFWEQQTEMIKLMEECGAKVTEPQMDRFECYLMVNDIKVTFTKNVEPLVGENVQVQNGDGSWYAATVLSDESTDWDRLFSVRRDSDQSDATVQPRSIQVPGCRNGYLFGPAPQYPNQPKDGPGPLIVTNYAWDSNSYPGNEVYWGRDYFTSSGDPAAWCCSTVGRAGNPEINTEYLSGHNAVVLKPAYQLGAEQQPAQVHDDSMSQGEPHGAQNEKLWTCTRAECSFAGNVLGMDVICRKCIMEKIISLKPGTWQCRCRLVNESDVCQACEGPAPLKPGEWRCLACTFVNQAGSMCEKCPTPRGKLFGQP